MKRFFPSKFDEEVTGVGSYSVGAACSSMKRLFPSKFDEEVTGVGSCSVGAACSSIGSMCMMKLMLNGLQ